MLRSVTYRLLYKKPQYNPHRKIMKKNLLIALFAAAALAPVAAQAERGYAGVNVGRTQQKATIDGIEGSAKENTTTVKAYGGFQFTPVFGIEGGLVELGKIKEEDGGGAFSIRPRSLYVAATGTLQVKERLALFAKLGAASTHTKMTIEGFGSETIHETGLLAGVGISYGFTPTVWGVAEYEDFGKIVKQDGVTMKAAALTFGLRFKF
jgi:OOP family OmpA-OmpF porin